MWKNITTAKRIELEILTDLLLLSVPEYDKLWDSGTSHACLSVRMDVRLASAWKVGRILIIFAI
jgi:hypothetical protein